MMLLTSSSIPIGSPSRCLRACTYPEPTPARAAPRPTDRLRIVPRRPPARGPRDPEFGPRSRPSVRAGVHYLGRGQRPLSRSRQGPSAPAHLLRRRRAAGRTTVTSRRRARSRSGPSSSHRCRVSMTTPRTRWPSWSSCCAPPAPTRSPRVVQQRVRPDRKTYLGRGKLDELHEMFPAHRPDLVAVNGELSAGQQRALEDRPARSGSSTARRSSSTSSPCMPGRPRANSRSSWRRWSTRISARRACGSTLSGWAAASAPGAPVRPSWSRTGGCCATGWASCAGACATSTAHAG